MKYFTMIWCALAGCNKSAPPPPECPADVRAFADCVDYRGAACDEGSRPCVLCEWGGYAVDGCALQEDFQKWCAFACSDCGGDCRPIARR